MKNRNPVVSRSRDQKRRSFFETSNSRRAAFGRKLRLEALEARLVLASLTWVGDVNNLWSTNSAGNTNWSGDVVPQDGDDLVFPAVAANFTNTNDITGLDLTKIEFAGTAYVVGGNAVSFTDGITDGSTAGANQLNLDLAFANTQTVTVSDASTTLSLGGSLSGSSSGAGLTKVGTGTLVLSAANTYDGATSINAGGLRLGATNVLPDASAVSVGPGAALDLNSNSDTVASLSGSAGGTLSLGTGTLTAGGNNSTTVFAGAISGSGGLTKVGTGVLTLAGNSPAYTGTTTVNAGTVLVNANHGNSHVSIGGGTLGGTGTVGPITSAGGNISPGNSPGRLSVVGDGVAATSDVALNSSSTYTVELNGTTAGTQYDQLDVTGSMDLGGASLAPSLGFSANLSDSFTIINTSEGVSGTFNGLPDLGLLAFGSKLFQIDYTATSVVLTVIGDTVFDGTGGDDTFIVNATGADSGTITINGGTPIPFTGINSLTFNGLAGNDLLRVNNPAGGLFAPAGGVTFNGGADSGLPGDRLEILGGTTSSGSLLFNYDPSTADGNNGDISVGAASYTYTGLEPILVDLDASPVQAMFNLPDDGTDNLAILEDNGDLNDGLVQLRSGNGSFETTVFNNPTFDTRINASDDGETITLARLDNGYTAFVDFFGDTGNDRAVLDFSSGVNIIPTVGPNQMAFVAGAGIDGMSLLAGYSATNIDYTFGDVQGLDLGPQAGTISIDGRGITYQGIDPAAGISDGLAASNRSFTFDAGLVGDKVILLGDDPTASNGVSRLSGNAGTPIVDFADPTTLLTLNAGVGNDTINVSTLDTAAASPTAINVNGESGNDTLALANGASLGTGVFDGGSGTDTIDYTAYTTAVAVNLGSNAPSQIANLDGDQETPPNSSTASASATLTYNNVARTFDINVTVTGIPLAQVTGFHLHRAVIGVAGPIIVFLDAPGVGTFTATPGGFTYTATNVPLPAIHEAAFLGGLTYLNVHTNAFPGGEIRGQVFPGAAFVAAPGTATNTGGVVNVENATGGNSIGQFGDSLVGDLNANVLRGGLGNDVLVGSGGPDTMDGGADNDFLAWSDGDGSDVMDGGAGSDTVNVNGDPGAGDTFTIGAGAGGRVAVAPGPSTLDIGTTESLTVNGTTGNDNFTVNDLTGVASLGFINLNGLAGSDTFNVQPALTVTINVSGFDPELPTLPGDTLNFNGLGLATTVNPTSILVPGRQPVNYRGIETLNLQNIAGGLIVDGTNGDDVFRLFFDPARGPVFQINGGAITSIDGATSITFNGLGGNDLLIVDSSAGDAVPSGGVFFNGGSQTTVPGDRMEVIGNGLNHGFYYPSSITPGDGRIEFDGNTIVFTGLEPVLVSAFFEFTLVTPNSNDVLTVDSPAAGQNRVSGTSGAVAFEALSFFDIDHFKIDASTNDNPLASTNDSVTFTSTLVATDLASFTLHTGEGNDTASVLVPGDARVTQAAESTSGLIDQTGAGVSVIPFVGLELLNISSGAGGSELTIRGTDDNDTIAVGLVGITAAWINDGTVVRYNVANDAFNDVIVQGRFGSDTFSVTPHDFVNFTVDGGDPSGSDKLVVATPPSGDPQSVIYTPTSINSALLEVTDPNSLITINQIEELLYDGRGDSEHITFNLTAGNDTVVHTPGAANDEGAFRVNNFLPFNYQNLGSGTGFTIDDLGGTDTAVMQGTPANDAFTLNPGDPREVFQNARLPILWSVLVENLTLNGLDGDDTFNIPGNPFFATINVNGGNPSASDVLNFNGTGGAVTVDLSVPSIAQAGFGAVALTGVEVLNANAGAGAITVNGTTGPDHISVTPTGASTATIAAAGLNLTINTSNSGLLSIDSAGGSDNLAVTGTQNGETITVNATLVTVGALKTVNYASAENLQVFGQAGDDTFDVTPSATTTIFIDGGDPIGTTAGDKLNIVGAPHTFEPGPESDEGGFVFDAAQRVSFDHIEEIGPIVGAPCVIVLGTNGDDDITIIARDNSYDLLADGVHDFTVSVNGGPEILYIDTLQLYVDGLAGDDDIVLRTPAPGGVAWDVDVFIAGGTPSAETGDQGDVFELETPGTQTVTYEPTGSDSGIIDVVTLSSVITLGTFTNACPSPAGNDGYNSSVGGVEEFVYDGEGASDSFTIIGTGGGDTILATPGAGNDEGSLRANTLLGVNYQNLGATATLAVDAGGGTDTLVIDGTANNDSFSVASGTGAVSLNARLVVNQTNTESLALRGLSGDDTFTIPGNHGYAAIAIEGGDPSASDVLNFAGTGGDVTIDLQAGTVQEAGFGPVSLTGVEVLNANAGAGAIIVNGRTGPETISVTPTGTDTTTIAPSGLNLTVNTNNTSTLTIDALSGSDTVTVNGSDAPNSMTVTYGAAATTVAITGLKSVDMATANTEFLQLNTLGGVDAITLNNNATIVTDVNAGGPDAADTMTYNVATSARVTQADVSTSGLIDQAGSNVSFSGLALLNMTSATAGSTLTVRGTDDNDHIDVGLVGITAFWINDGTVVRYNSAGGTNFSTVVGQGRFGNDFFSITPHAGVAITVQGGNPTASDTAVVNGTTGPDTINFSPTASDAGTVQVNALGLVTLATVELLSINGLGGGDALTVTTPTGGQNIDFTPGAAVDAGTVTVTGSSTLLPLDFLGLGAAGNVTLADADGARVDALRYHGTAANDLFNVAAASGGTIARAGSVNLLAPSVFTAILDAVGGDDSLFINSSLGAIPIANLFFVGGEGNDDFIGIADGSLISISGVDGVQQSIVGGGFAAAILNLDGVERSGLSGVGDLQVSANAAGSTLTATLLPPGSIEFRSSTAPTVISVFSVANLNVLSTAADQRLAVRGTAAAEAITVSGTNVTVGALEPVNYSGFEALEVYGQEGNDAFVVTPAAIPIFIDGGDPIGTIPGDSLTVNGSITVAPGPENDEGGVLTPGETVSFDHIESLIVTPVQGCPFLIVGTNGDDDITIIARDASTHPSPPFPAPGADGVQDFTYSINAGPNILVLNAPDVYIDAASGDDDIVIRAPAPNDASWGVNVRVAGGPPSIGETNEADRLVLETPGPDNIVFTPTGPDTGSILVDEGNDGGFNAGIDTLVTFGSFTFVCDQFTYNSSPGGVELVEYDGESPSDVITIAGSAGNDVTTLHPLAVATGSFVSGFSPLFNFRSFSQITVNSGGVPGFDQVVVNGTDAGESVTSDATTLFGLGASVTIGAGIDQLTLNTFGGVDVVTLSLAVAGLAKTVDVGTGNDFVNLSGVAVDLADPTIFGGDGDDTLVGSPNADLIFGGAGNDVIIGGGGVDQEYGEDGNDRFGDPALRDPAANDGGNDQFFGGAGSDVFFWDPGDGDDLIEGGAGDSDQLFFFGNAGAEQFFLFADTTAPSRFHLFRVQAAIDIDAADLEEVNLATLGGADAVTVGRSDLGVLSDLTTTTVQVVDVNVGGDGLTDNVFFDGRPLGDNLLVSLSAAIVKVAGLSYDLRIEGSDIAGTGPDRLTVRGNEGDDTIKAEAGVEATILITLDGGAGDDNLSADAILIGGPGDDFLEGGAGDDQLFGNAGEDTMIGGLGADTFDGGPDFDTILVRGTSGNDIISANQTTPTTLVTTLNGVADTDTLVTVGGVRTVERVRIEAGSGDDTIFVMHADSLGTNAFVDAVLFDIDGGSAATRDRLSVQDDGAVAGTGDLLLYRKGESDSAGSISVGPGNAESLENVFANVEFIQPIAGTGGQLLVFKHDPFENNDERINATHLGAGETINVDPTIDPGPLTSGIPAGFQPLPGDQDWYRIVAEKTGTLDFQVYFTMFATVPSGRPGLPNAGNLDLELYDADGTLIVSGLGAFGLNDATNDERIRIPAVEGQSYFLRVFGVTTAINNYNITVVNTPAPVPFDLELDDIIATSSVAGGIIFGAADQRFNGGAALPNVNGFFNGKDVYFTEGNLNGQRGRVVNYIGATRTFVFAANTFSTALGALAVGDDFQIESIDTGRSQLDNITRDNTPTIFLRVADSALLNDIPDNAGNPGAPPDEVIPIPFVASTLDNAPSAGFRVAVFRTENNTHTHVGYAQPVAGSPGVYSFTFASAIPDGSNFISARVEMIDPASPEQAQGFGAFAQSLEIVVDTAPPPVFFGLPNDANDGLLPDSDTGLNTNPETLNDLVTSDTTPGFFGQAEADAVIRLFIDAPQAGAPTGNGIFEPGIDFQIGFDVAEPFDGTNQYPNGYWQVDAVNVDLNAPPFSPTDGLRRIFVTAEDVAGNINPGTGQIVQEFEIFIDTQGPQITDVEINNVGNPYDLFDPKPSNDGPTPLVHSIVISVQDLPLRTPEFLVPAIKADIAENPGHYLLTGDYNGIIPIQDVIVTLLPVVAGQPARATIELVVWDFGPDGTPFTLDDLGAPLPDDRFTLFINDEGIIDRAGNILDGESNADEPHDQDALDPEILGVDGFPSGDGLPGGDFIARFTIDSVAEVGTWGAGSAWLDTNGNTSFDPTNEDFTNRDITYILGLTSDDLFAGNFALGAGDVADGFDKLAAYGRVSGVWRWLVDTDNDGVPNVNQPDPAGINGLPVAGNFDGNAANGDEVGLFTGTTWWFDTNHDFRVDFSIAAAAGFIGYPVVGDFDGDGNDDLGAWTDDTFRFNLSGTGATVNANLPGLNGAVEESFHFGFSGPNERPVADDVNEDGFDDIGLYVPNRAGAAPDEAAEWYILVSGEVRNNDAGPATLGPSIMDRIVIDPISGQNVVRFTPKPFGRDIYLHYGDEFGLPILGNFDPPVSPTGDNPGNNTRDPLDVNNDGKVSAFDALLIINHMNLFGPASPPPTAPFPQAPYLDVNGSGLVTPSDALAVVNYLNLRASQQSSGPEGEADDFFSELGESGSAQQGGDDVLAMLADDLETQRRKRG